MKLCERDIHSAVIDHWRACGLPGTLVATIPNEAAYGQPGLTRGLPDLVVIAPDLPVGFIELKVEGGRLSRHQKNVHATMRESQVPLAVTYGRDEPIEILKQWGAVR